MKTDNLIPAASLDRRELAPGVQLCFTRLDAPLCPPPLDWPRLLVFDFCRSGRRAIPDGAQYAIVTEGHAAVSFAVPGADFYLPGSQYEALQLFIDPDAVQADSFLTLMGLEIGGIADYFCRGGVHCCPMSDAITAIVDEVWDDAAYAAPGELRYAAVRLLYELHFHGGLTREEGVAYKQELKKDYERNLTQEAEWLRAGTAMKLLRQSENPEVKKIVGEVETMF